MWKAVIVDDDRQVLKSMKKMFPWHEVGIELCGEALDGKEGLSVIRNVRPDIVITDIYMPVMDGLDMAEQLRRDGFDGLIYILSGYSEFQYALKAIRLQVDDYLPKPVTLNTLKDVLSEGVRKLEEKKQRLLEKEEIMNKIMLYEPFVQKQYIRSLVAGTLPPHEMQTLIGENDLIRRAAAYLTMGLEIVRTERVSRISTGDWNLFRFAVENIVHEILEQERATFFFVELPGNHMAVLLLDPGDCGDSFHQGAIALAKKMIHAVDKYLNIQVRMGLGQVKSHWKQIADSTEEAFLSLSLKICAPYADTDLYVYAGDHAVFGGPEENARNKLRPIQFVQQLTEAIRCSNCNKIRQILDVYLAQLEKQDDTKPTTLQQYAEEIWRIFEYALYGIGGKLEEKLRETNVEMEIRNIVRIDQLRSWAENKIEQLFKNTFWSENIKHKQAVEFMIDYIHEHYAEDITLGELSEKVHISRNYLSDIFKKATGDTFNEYLTKVRMEKARTLLLEGKLLIYEIAEKVGYKNVPYFSTQFKKYTGLNPSDFQRL